MRWHSSLTAVLGLAAGAAFVAFLPRETLFVSAPAASSTAALSAPGERWACPMMDFIGQKPGDCPVCGMKMTRVTAGELTREQQRRMGVELTTIATVPARAVIRAYGTVRFDERSQQVVIPRVPGRIVHRHPAALHAGTLVAAGDPVVDLYSPEAYAAQGELVAALALKDRYAIDALTQRLIRWNLGALARSVAAGGQPVDTVTIASPFSGLVVGDNTPDAAMSPARLPQVGQEVMADTPLLRLADPQRFIVALRVPETRAHWVRLGQTVQLASDDRGDLPDVAASVAWLAPDLDPELRTREVHLHLEDPQRRLLAGSLVSARLEAALGPDLNPAAAPATFTAVPKSAVLSTGVRHVAWRVAGRDAAGRLSFAIAPLALGPRLEDPSGHDVFLVRAGLQPGDEVATQGLFLIDAQAQLAGSPSLLFPQGAVSTPAPHPH